MAQAGRESGVFLHAPSLVVAEVAVDELRVVEAPVAASDGGPDARSSVAGERRDAVGVPVDGEARMVFDAPALGVAEQIGGELGGLEAAVTIVEGRPHAVVAEADD